MYGPPSVWPDHDLYKISSSLLVVHHDSGYILQGCSAAGVHP